MYENKKAICVLCRKTIRKDATRYSIKKLDFHVKCYRILEKAIIRQKKIEKALKGVN